MNRREQSKPIVSLLKEECGSLSVLMSGTVLTLVLMAGMALDLGRTQAVKTAMQNSTDAAALAGALYPGDQASKKARAEQMFRANWTNNYFSTQTPPAPTVTFPSGAIKVASNYTMPTSYMMM